MYEQALAIEEKIYGSKPPSGHHLDEFRWVSTETGEPS